MVCVQFQDHRCFNLVKTGSQHVELDNAYYYLIMHVYTKCFQPCVIQKLTVQMEVGNWGSLMVTYIRKKFVLFTISVSY